MKTRTKQISGEKFPPISNELWSTLVPYQTSQILQLGWTKSILQLPGLVPTNSSCHTAFATVQLRKQTWQAHFCPKGQNRRNSIIKHSINSEIMALMTSLLANSNVHLRTAKPNSLSSRERKRDKNEAFLLLMLVTFF